ncbi:uncharacterized protein AC631_05200 [Debaryomyces fabryi]|uniref:Major facilitator superfamily (MFS) profile domain-containing protein n=1 Tax=Debaryomyces fabryi TaxID=58627 RepID=A0A0V1PS21_9ASCO|nr:uncharacterized protein AC631_05200 [Debaryomyces fabryi]KRZ99032.1 hypothetical protein AC631_05200 [Debaryomyces fabryi]CUM55900.1 unnamed protein product [Debaryomyces fabryi]
MIKQSPRISEEKDDHELTQFVEETAILQQTIEHTFTRFEAIKAYPRTCVYILILLWVMILVGYENQAGGMVVSIPTFRRDFGYYFEGDYVLDGKWQSAISGGPSGAIVIGGFIGSYMADSIGRKLTLLIAVGSTIGFIVLEYVSTTIEVFFAGKFLNALSLGIIATVSTSLVAEITPLALRGISVAAVSLSLSLGPFVCYLIANSTSERLDRMAYRSLFLSQWVFSGTSFIMLFFIPESPYYFVLKNADEKALIHLRKLYKGEALAEHQLILVKKTVEEARHTSISSSFIDCFRGINLKRTFIAISPFVMQPMSGVAYIGSYSTYFFQLSGFDTQKSFQISVGQQALSILGCITSWFILDKFGRRHVMLYGMISLFILNIITAGLGCSKEKSYLTGASAFMTMYNFFYNSSIGPLSYVITAENPSSQLRVKTISIGLAVNNGLQCMWQFILPFMFNPDQANMGSKINFIFAACCFVSIFCFYFWLPETANRSFDEIDEMYIKNIPARKFRNFISDTQIKVSEIDEQKGPTAEHIEA